MDGSLSITGKLALSGKYIKQCVWRGRTKLGCKIRRLHVDIYEKGLLGDGRQGVRESMTEARGT